MKLQTRSLPQVKDKIMKYDSFLLKNRTELNSKEFQQSMTGQQAPLQDLALQQPIENQLAHA